jgi:hypothetical protein
MTAFAPRPDGRVAPTALRLKAWIRRSLVHHSRGRQLGHLFESDSRHSYRYDLWNFLTRTWARRCRLGTDLPQLDTPKCSDFRCVLRVIRRCGNGANGASIAPPFHGGNRGSNPLGDAEVPSMHEVGLDVEPAVDSARTVLPKARATSCAASHGCSSLMTSCRGVCKNHCGGRCRDDAASESAVASRATTDPIRRGLAKCALLTRSEKPRNPCRLQLALFRH